MAKQPRGPLLNCYETTISTVENPPQTATRILEPQFQQERQSDFAQPPPGWPQTPDPGLSTPRLGMGARRPKGLPFGRSSRIKQGRDFLRLKQQGERMTIGCLIVNWLRLNEGTCSRLGVVTSSRIGGAVVRNRARRLMRESFRLNQQRLAQPLDLVLVARQSIAGKTYAQVEKDLLTSLGKAGLLKGPTGK